MPNTNPPWPPERDEQSIRFWEKLQTRYDRGNIDFIGAVRWPSEFRMHMANGISEDNTWITISNAIDAIRSGRQPDPTLPGPYDLPWAPEMDRDCEPFINALRGTYQNEHPNKPQSVDAIGYVRWGSEFRMHRANGMNLDEAWEAVLQEIRKIWRSQMPVPVTDNRPFIGSLRIENKLFRDDAGYRRVFFTSWFPALRILRDDPNEFYRQLDEIVKAGYQGIRIFLAVGGWSDFWDGREVVPITFQKWWYTGNMLRSDRYGDILQSWPNYDVLLSELLDACIARNIRLHITVGDFQIICKDPTIELEFHRKVSSICKQKGGTTVIAFVEATNEFPINRHGSDSPSSIEQMGRVLKIWSDAIPGILTGQGAIPQNEEPASLRLASTHGNVCVVHTTRSPFQMNLKRTFGLVYWEGDYRGFPKPFWQGEPAGPGYDSFDPMNDPAALTALYAMHALTGQASNQFAGPSVRSLEPLESVWGFRELPRLFAKHLPEDVATWEHGNNRYGGIEYWWKNNIFVTSTCKDWDPSPPRNIAEWTLYSGDNVSNGAGTPPRGTGLLTGRFF